MWCWQTPCSLWGLKTEQASLFFSVLLVILKVDIETNGVPIRRRLTNVSFLLDGVQEVAYIHSNQNVIGSSKAENHMSRWAARDVFELKQFSQLPANVAVCTATVRSTPAGVTSSLYPPHSHRSYSGGSSLRTPPKVATKKIRQISFKCRAGTWHTN